MLFNSLHFVFFFPIVVALHFALPFRFRWAFLLAASYYFYMCWRPEYALLLAVSTLVDYVAARRMGMTDDRRRRRKYLFLSLGANLGLLFTFKYFNFFFSNFGFVLDYYGFRHPALNVLLPMGISFYTLQTLSYTIDVYRGEKAPERHLGYFALYVSFFPQLVAGPIERSTRLLPQLFVHHKFDYDRMRSGLLLMAAGFFKKLVIADRLAIYVAGVYDHPEGQRGLVILLATYLYSIQIFCDFSGYSDIAIGAARIMGYDLMENFRRPFHAQSTAEFWRRWHISLSTWLRDYIYVPLGGNRRGKARSLINIVIVFLISGLWHGAAWNFVIFGGLHGAYIVIDRLTGDFRARLRPYIYPHAVVERVARAFIVFNLWSLSMLFFRSRTLENAATLLGNMVAGFPGALGELTGTLSGIEFGAVLAAIAVMEAAHIAQTRGSIEARLLALPTPFRWAFYYAMAAVIMALGVFQAEEFIYFQF